MAAATDVITRSPSFGATALAVLAAGQLVAYGMLSGRPNVVLMVTAVFPALVACLLWTNLRWVTAVAVFAAVATILGTRVGNLAFDLARPDAVIPFAVAVLQLMGAGVAVGTTVVTAMRPYRLT